MIHRLGCIVAGLLCLWGAAYIPKGLVDHADVAVFWPAVAGAVLIFWILIAFGISFLREVFRA